MKQLLLCVLLLTCSAIAQDSLRAAEPPASGSDAIVAALVSPVQKLNQNDFKKFYIGFTSNEKAIEVITLDIKHTESADSSIKFYYTLNTNDNREDGTGQIWPAQSKIRFQNYEEGKITLPEDGKIVFESITRDSLSYWKLKEK